MRTQVTQGPGAGQLALEAPRERHVGIGAGVENEAAGERPDVAENALSHQSPRLGDGRVAKVVEPNECSHARLLCGLVHLFGIGGTERERLLTVDMLTGRDRGHRDLLVQEVRCDDVDNVNLGSAHRLTPVDRPAVVSKRLGTAPRQILLGVGQDRELWTERRPAVHTLDVAVAHGVRLRHQPAADHGDAEIGYE